MAKYKIVVRLGLEGVLIRSTLAITCLCDLDHAPILFSAVPLGRADQASDHA